MGYKTRFKKGTQPGSFISTISFKGYLRSIVILGINSMVLCKMYIDRVMYIHTRLAYKVPGTKSLIHSQSYNFDSIQSIMLVFDTSFCRIILSKIYKPIQNSRSGKLQIRHHFEIHEDQDGRGSYSFIVEMSRPQGKRPAWRPKRI